jgi:hypothetical protein
VPNDLGRLVPRSVRFAREDAGVGLAASLTNRDLIELLRSPGLNKETAEFAVRVVVARVNADIANEAPHRRLSGLILMDYHIRRQELWDLIAAAEAARSCLPLSDRAQLLAARSRFAAGTSRLWGAFFFYTLEFVFLGWPVILGFLIPLEFIALLFLLAPLP